MQFIFALFVISLFLIPARGEVNDTFFQEMAVIYTMRDGLPDSVVTNIWITEEGNPVSVTNSGMAIFSKNRWQSYTQTSEKNQTISKINESLPILNVLCVTRRDEFKVAGAKDGLYFYEPNTGQWQCLYPADHNYSWALSNVKVVEFDSKGRLWFGADQGVGFLENKRWHLFTGREGLPYKNFTCITTGENGAVWFGTEKGVIRTDGKNFAYRFSRRWLPHDHVNDIAIADDGSAWIATNNGVSHIFFKAMTLEEKADYFIDQVETRHNRMGFVAPCVLQERYNIESWAPAISDNDGMYTAMYGAAQAFRYAVTGDRDAKEIANRCFDACKWLVDITHEAGFPARVIIPIDWHEPVNEQYGPEYNKRRQKTDPFWKDIIPRFVTSRDGKYLWKCDTSSDELAGHYFFYGIYYDLVAQTAEEKEKVRKVVADITDHLIRHGFFLCDHDGKATRWGNFSPEFLETIWGWEQRGLNSMMMLSFLNVAEHVTGDKKYAETAQMLRDKHHYHINAMQAKIYYPPENVVPWDNNLCLMSMYGLINYEKDPELLLMYRLSMEHAWLHISRQKNAFWNVIYAALAKRFTKQVLSGVYSSHTVFPEAGPYANYTAKQLQNADFRYGDIMETLKKLPLDLIGYVIDNTHRLDIVFDPTPGQFTTIGWHVSGWALPIDERGHLRQDRDAFNLITTEADRYTEHEGSFFLLPYYMARYHGIIR